MSSQRRIVITGMGWVTPLGHSLDAVWKRLTNGESGVRPIDRFDAGSFPTTFAASIRDYDYRSFLADPEVHAHAGQHSQYALGAAVQAWRQSGLGDVSELDRRRVGIYLGAGEGVLDFEGYARTNLDGWNPESRSMDAAAWAKAASEHFDPWRELEQEPNMPASHISRELGIRGPVYNCLTACAASTQAVGEATDIIRRGDADVMVSGGSHTMLHVLGVTGFNRLTALSNRNDAITEASRPFSRSRDGFVMGEGAGVVVLEEYEHAKARGATIYAEVLGYGMSGDAYHITAPSEDGNGAERSMRAALKRAGIAAEDVHYINAHGTSTMADVIELAAVERVLGDAAEGATMSSTKSSIGHLLGAAGAVEAIFSILAMRDQVAPPTINLDTPAVETPIDLAANAKRPREIVHALSNSFGFGGTNASLVFGHPDR
ncbi:MAG: beta-ketoacyl synthase [Phycisphaerales bacterium]